MPTSRSGGGSPSREPSSASHRQISSQRLEKEARRRTGCRQTIEARLAPDYIRNRGRSAQLHFSDRSHWDAGRLEPKDRRQCRKKDRAQLAPDDHGFRTPTALARGILIEFHLMRRFYAPAKRGRLGSPHV